MWRKNDAAAFLKAVNKIDHEFQRWSQNDNVGDDSDRSGDDGGGRDDGFGFRSDDDDVIMMVTSAGTWGPSGATLLYPVQPLQSLTFFSKPKPSH